MQIVVVLPRNCKVHPVGAVELGLLSVVWCECNGCERHGEGKRSPT